MHNHEDIKKLKQEELLEQLQEANNVLSAIKNGEVDALLVSHHHKDQVYILKGADYIYRVLVEEMQEGYLTIDISGHILFCNRKFAELVNVPLDKIIGSPTSLYFSLSDLSAMNQTLNAGQARYKKETWIKTQQGKQVSVNISSARLTMETDMFACIVVTDLTEQKRREKFTNLVLDQATEAILVCDTNGAIVKANTMATSLFGEQIVSQQFDSAIPLYCEIRHKSLNLESLLRHENDLKQEICFNGKDSTFYFLVSASMLLDKENGEAFGSVVMLTDITDNLKFKKEMNRLDRLNIIGEMAAGIGHEVRNPMTTVRGFLQHFVHKDEFKKHRASFDLMIEELDRANSIITEFLSLAKNKTVERHPVNINSLIKNILPLLQADALRLGHQIIFMGESTHEIHADEKEIRQCILNLVRNGLEAMKTNGTLYIKTLEQNEKVFLTVIDQGEGIPDTIMDKIGTPFFYH
ncbi:PAS domain-containing protein [Sporomusa ovata]|uniref:histidine kinase n=1 Tax=Sporomusa ovata TaxID=2378 RepID=A0A0U1L7T6_9FIRM|nr:PAS domain-containing protein [Sporomusa ovata]CQR74934.1 Sporulation kinase [Sporomusa ovata]